MALESATHISDLVVSNPTAVDGLSQGDDHLRMIKTVLKTDFPNITGAMTVTQADLNTLGANVANYLKKDGSVAMTGALAMGSHKVTGVTDGTAATDAATKGQMDTADALKADKATTISAGAGLTGGGSLASNRTLAVDINGQTEDTTPDIAADFVMTYDASAGALKKAKPSNLAPAASDTVAGRIEIATAAEVLAATDVNRAVTPGRMAKHPLMPVAWATFTASTGAIVEGSGISSITRVSAGRYTTTHPAMTSATYGAVVMGSIDLGTKILFWGRDVDGTQTSTSYPFRFVNSGGAAIDPDGLVTIVLFGTLA